MNHAQLSLSCGLVTQLTTTTSEPLRSSAILARIDIQKAFAQGEPPTMTAIDGGGHLGTAAAARVAWTTFGAFWVSIAVPTGRQGCAADICVA